MISPQAEIILSRPVTRVATLTQDGRTAQVTVQPASRFYVVAAGRQGPVGHLSEGAARSVEQAERAALQAVELVQATAVALDDLVQRLESTFEYHAGAIAAQQR
ncbi:hypothetical protein N7650_14790 [Pseudomonas sp. GD04058]|uniref:hypothetical protein n=1 Tax=Pseudomonas sp. GD04058 TaxID=2975429 RepID=UPI00244A1099|nr:hypothetical protein [Pseudomonas sp. GD04058]MDG9884104.1 hypothetical protein [Pseudomonas sp. GD04058]